MELALDDGKKLLQLHRLGENETLDSTDVCQGLSLAGNSGQQNHGNVAEGKVVAEIREDASTIALGHHDVEKDQVGHAMTHRIHREQRVVFDNGLVADSVQCLGEQGRHGNVVVDD